MKKILILGHKGMLGNAVYKFFSTQDEYTLLTTENRWGDNAFNKELRGSNAEVIINCIGIIPQKKHDVALYTTINVELPIFLESLNKNVVHPSTDCEFSGNVASTYKYRKDDVRDAADDYGKSKAEISKRIESGFKNTKIIRTSIIGHEEKTHLSLLDWFLNSVDKVNGYTNHYWNGITTLEWAKQCENLINNWDNSPVLNQYGTKDIRSKYDLLNDIKNVYAKKIEITPFESPTAVNKCLESDKEIASITEQLKELREFYKK